MQRIVKHLGHIFRVFEYRPRLAADLLRLSLRHALRNRRRYRGAVVAVALGVAALTAVITLGDTIEELLGRDLELLGSATIVEARWDFDRSLRWHHGSYSLRDEEDLRKLPGVMAVAAVIWKKGERITYKKRNVTARIGAVDESFFRAVALPAAFGRQLNQADYRAKAARCTIGKELAEQLFGSEREAVGKSVLLQYIPFQVVGVLGWNLDPDYEHTMLIPLSLAQGKIRGMNKIRHLRVRAVGWSIVPELASRVQEVLVANQPGYGRGISVFYYKDRLANIENIVILFKTFVYLAILVVIILGGISISNVMAGVVVERTREIGLSLALGATPATIVMQFLFESVTASCLGGLIGIGIGSLAVEVGARLIGAGFDYRVFLLALLASAVLSVLLGLISGVVPAVKASEMDCMQAMRFE
ncbi:MAG: ABC transporter permease [Deltaproteobacteria bacterium]